MVNTYTRIISTGFHSRGPHAHALDYPTLMKISTTTTTTAITGKRRTEAAPNPSPEKEEGSSIELNVRRSIAPVSTFCTLTHTSCIAQPAKPAKATTVAKTPKNASSLAEADEELRRRLEEISGEGGASGVETEDGKPTSMKRAVRNNMFRYI